jgi:hypothetical protein
MKKFISFLLLLAFTFGLPSSYIVASANSISLTFEQALDIVEKNNSEIKLLDKKITIYERQYNDDLKKAKEAEWNVKYNGKIDLDMKMKELVNWRKKLLELNNQKNIRDERLIELKLDVQKYYLNSLLLQDEIQNLQNELLTVDKKIGQINAKIKSGQLKPTDSNSLKTQRSQLVSLINTTKRQLDTSILDLKKLIGMDSKSQIALAPYKVEFKKFDDKDMEKKIKESIEKSYEIIRSIEDLKITKIEYDITAEYAHDDDENDEELSMEALQLEVSLKDKELGIGDLTSSSETKLWSSYYNLKNLEDTIEIEKLNLLISEIELTFVQSKVKVDLANFNDESNVRVAVSKQKSKLQRHINDYCISALSFRNELGE